MLSKQFTRFRGGIGAVSACSVGVLVFACQVDSPSYPPARAPASPPPVRPAPPPPVVQPSRGSPFRPQPARSVPPRVSACETSYVQPFPGQLWWRAAYRSGKPGHFIGCPDWSHFGPVRPRGKWHKGLDIAAPTGTPVRAAVNGRMIYARDPKGWGLFARIRYVPSVRAQAGGCVAAAPMRIIYAHLMDNRPGLIMGKERAVRAGEVIGQVGCSGNASGMCSPSPESHVHITLRRVGGSRQKVDPLPVFKWNIQAPHPSMFVPPLGACIGK